MRSHCAALRNHTKVYQVHGPNSCGFSRKEAAHKESREETQSPAEKLFLFAFSPIPLPLLGLLKIDASQQQQKFLPSVARAGSFLFRPSKSPLLKPSGA